MTTENLFGSSTIPEEFRAFFLDAQSLSDDEYLTVLLRLPNRETKARFHQQRRYGGRTFLQAGLDGLPVDIEPEKPWLASK